MAIANVATRANAASAAGGTSWAGLVLTTGSSITVGNTLVMELAYRNYLVGGSLAADVRPQPGNSLCVDLRGNLWRCVGVTVNTGDDFVTPNGAIASIWVCHVKNPYTNGDIITLTAQLGPLTSIVGRIVEWSGVKRVDRAFQSVSGYTGISQTAASIPTIQPGAIGQMVYGVVAVSGGPTLTGDGDATDGSWTGLSQQAQAGQMVRGAQQKIVTGTSAQTYDVTWTGAQNWAGIAVILEEAQIPWPFNNERLANPGYPCPAGAEILPTDTVLSPVDTGTAYIFDVNLPPESSDTSSIYWSSSLRSLDPASDMQHTIMCEVYPQDEELAYNQPTVINFGTPIGATLFNGAITTDGGSAVAALAAPGGAQVQMETLQYVRCRWDFTDLTPYLGTYRIVDVRINYVAWKDDSAAPQPGEGLAAYWYDSSARATGNVNPLRYLHGAWLVNEYQNTAKRTYRSLGEVNGFPQIGMTQNLQYGNLHASFTVDDFLRMNTSRTSIEIWGLNGSAPSQETVFLDTIELELALIPERRIAHGARRVSSGVGFPDGLVATTGQVSLPLYSTTTTLNFWRTPANGNPVAVVLREGVPASPSDWFGAQYNALAATDNFGANFRYASAEAVGPSAAFPTITQPRPTIDPVPDVSRVAWSGGQIAPNSVPEPINEMIYAVVLSDPNSYLAFWPGYENDNLLAQGVSSTTPRTVSVATDGVSSYDYVRLLLQAPDSVNAPTLSISVEQPTSTVLATATITKADLLAQPDLGNGYREIHVPLSATITPSGATAVEIRLTSTTPENDPWVTAAGIVMDTTSGYTPFPQQGINDGPDYAVVLCCELPDLDLDIDSSPIEIENNGNTPCASTGSNIPCITINNAEQYDWITIQRRVGALDTVPLALLDVNSQIVYPTVEVQDDFNRTVVGGWGTPTVGPAWTTNTTNPGSTFAVNSGRGSMTLATANSLLLSEASQTISGDVSQRVRVALPSIPTGNPFFIILFSSDNVDDQLFMLMSFATNGSVTVSLRQILTGVETQIGAISFPEVAAGQYVWMALDISNGLYRGKTWLETQAEPAWQFSAAIPGTMSPLVDAGVNAVRRTGNSSPDPTVYFDDYSLVNYTPQSVTYCDYGVPWDLAPNTISYEVQGFRDSDHRVTPMADVLWADSSPNAGAAFGLATDDGLFVYAPGSDSGDLELTWNRIYPVEMMPLAGKDYQIALRPAEVRGYSITTNVLVDKLSYCQASDESGVDDGTYDGLGIYDDDNFYDYPASSPTSEAPGAKGMAPTPFQQLNQLERDDALWLKLPGGHTRRVYFDSGPQALIPVIGLAMAEITLTDVPPPSIDPPFYPED